MADFTIPSLPPSMNKVYQIIRLPGQPLRVEMTPEVRRWKTEAKEWIPKLTATADSFTFRIDAVFHYNWYYKNGKMRKFDTQNLMKVLIDAVAEKNGIDDSYVKSGGWSSVHSTDKEFIVGKVACLSE